jgi:3-oxoadipate enol-lactonase
MAADVVEVLEALDVHDALVVGHSMGGMVAQTVVLEHRRRAAGRVAALVLVATSARTVLGGRLGARATATLAAGGGRAFGLLARRGWGLVPQEDLATWVARASFGTRADPAQVELARSMIAAMSPVAMAELSASLLSFDVVDRLGEIDLPTQVVVGTADLLTPPMAARVLAEGIPGATLTVLAGCGHMVMLERAPELDALLEGCPPRPAVR